MRYQDVHGIPVFCPGWHHGEYYPPERMRRIARNSNAMRPYFRAPLKLKLTHRDRMQPQLLHYAALGQMTRFYLQSGKGGPFVMADIAHVPEPVARVVPHHFPDVSVEKYRYFNPGDGRRIPDVIQSVAFLGADAPEVKGLKRAYPEIFCDTPHGVIEQFQIGGRPLMGDVVKAWREFMQMTPEDAAALLNITPEAYAALESGDTEPTPEQLATLADAFGTTVEALQAGERPPAAPADPGAAQFSERQVAQMIDRAVTQAVANTTRQFNAKLNALAARYKKTETELFSERKQRKTDRIAAAIAQLQKPNTQGLALPAVCVTMGLQQFMERLADTQVEQFGEGEDDTDTMLGWFERFAETLKEVGLVQEDELAGGDDAWRKSKANGQTADGLIQKYQEDHQCDYETAFDAISTDARYQKLFE